MSDVLFVKTSSLGDVIHHMPALTEARARRPALRFAWVVEEIVRAAGASASRGRRGHSGRIAALAPVAVRALRPGVKSANSGARCARGNYDHGHRHAGADPLRADRRVARGRRHGYDADSIRERAASLALRCPAQRLARPARDCAQPRADRSCARLCARGSAGLRARPGKARAAVAGSLRGAAACDGASATRNGRCEHWIALGQALRARNLRLVLPWGNGRERSAAARSLPRCRMPRCPICSRSTRSRA